MISVISRDLYDSYRGRIKPEPTIGEAVPATNSWAPLEPGERQQQPSRPDGVLPD